MADELETGTDVGDIDMGAAVDEIGAGLGLGIEPDGSETTTEPETVEAEATAPTEPVVETPAVRAAPKSWAKETHELFASLPPAAQEQIEKREKQFLDGFTQYSADAGFGKQLKEVITPFKPMLEGLQVTEAQAVQHLLGMHYKLSQGPMESRQAAWKQLGTNLGLIQDPNAPASDPRYNALEQQVQQLTSTVTKEQQRKLDEARTQVVSEVEAFAADPKNIYFDECAEDITRLITAGYPLAEAYRTAVRTNPVTSAKEDARILKEHEAKIRENLRLDGLKARKATSTNVRGRDTRTAPTDPLGTMEDTMKTTLREIKSRTH